MTLTSELVLFCLAVLGAVSGIWWRIEARIVDARNEALAAATRADARAAAAEKSLADHKLYAAETFATRAGMTEGFDKVTASIEKLGDRIDQFMTRDAPMKARPHAPRAG